MHPFDTLRSWAGTASDGVQEVLFLLSSRRRKQTHRDGSGKKERVVQRGDDGKVWGSGVVVERKEELVGMNGKDMRRAAKEYGAVEMNGATKREGGEEARNIGGRDGGGSRRKDGVGGRGGVVKRRRVSMMGAPWTVGRTRGLYGSLTSDGDRWWLRTSTAGERRWCTGLRGNIGRRRDWRGSRTWKGLSGCDGMDGAAVGGAVRVRQTMDFGASGLVGVALGGKRKVGKGEDDDRFVSLESERKKRRSIGGLDFTVANGAEENIIRSAPSTIKYQMNRIPENRDQDQNHVNHVSNKDYGDATVMNTTSKLNGPDSVLQKEIEKKKEQEKMTANAKKLNERARIAEDRSYPLRRNSGALRSTRFFMNGGQPLRNSLFTADANLTDGEQSPTKGEQEEKKHGGGHGSEYEGFMDNPLFYEKMARLGIDRVKMAKLGIDLAGIEQFEERQRLREAKRLRNERELIALRSSSVFSRERPIRLFYRSSTGIRGAEHLDVVYWEGDDAGWDENDPTAIDEKERGITVLDESDPLSPMTSSAVKRVRRYMTPASEDLVPKSKVIAELENVPITRGDLVRLKPNAWLNDEIINYYIELLKNRERDSGGKRFYFQNTFFYAKLYEFNKKKGGHIYDFTRVRRWTRKVDVFSYDKMIVPINQGNMHWSLCVINFKEKTVEHYDSLGSTSSPCARVLMRWVVDEAKHKKKVDLDDGEWSTVYHGTDVPQQCNSDDCGMFVCKFADYVAKDRKLLFNSDHVNYFRGRMASEILVQRAC